MKMYQFKTFIILLMFSLSAFGNSAASDFRNLKSLYQNINRVTDKIESEPLILKDYHLLISAATWSSESQYALAKWEAWAMSKGKTLNVIVVYDNYRQDLMQIQARAPQTKMYEFFDKSRSFYHWFETKKVPSAVLIGPKDKVLYNGNFSMPEHFQAVERILKTIR